jgi:hypothetical protein
VARLARAVAQSPFSEVQLQQDVVAASWPQRRELDAGMAERGRRIQVLEQHQLERSIGDRDVDVPRGAASPVIRAGSTARPR